MYINKKNNINNNDTTETKKIKRYTDRDNVKVEIFSNGTGTYDPVRKIIKPVVTYYTNSNGTRRHKILPAKSLKFYIFEDEESYSNFLKENSEIIKNGYFYVTKEKRYGEEWKRID